MLLAAWEVRIVKNCDRGLENSAQDRRPMAAFSNPTLSRTITFLISFWLTSEFVYATLNLLTRCRQTIST